MAAVVTSTASSRPMIVEKVLALPIVSDIYTYGERATRVRTLELRGWVYHLFLSSLVICGEGVSPSTAVLRDDDGLPALAGPEGGQPEGRAGGQDAGDHLHRTY